MGTCSKSLGSEGGFVCGSRLLIEFLINQARSFIFSTALSPGVMAASMNAVEIIQNEPHIVKRLQENIQFFCACLRENGIPASSQTAIIPVIIGDEEKALEVSQRLAQDGFYIPAIRYPTVAKGAARLRAALMSSHTKTELEAAAAAIGKAVL
jgi:7-keto-8-aminopelargonate synthetase-like enzyme